MQTFFEQLTNSKIKSYLILIGIIIPSLQALFFIYLYGVNVPFLDDWEVVNIFELFFNDNPIWAQKIFGQHNEHRIFFPYLIFLANGVLTSWNVVTQMYLSWILIGISLIPIYLILKKTRNNFVWLMIPISFIMYSPLQVENFLWGHQLQWFLGICCLIWSFYFLNNLKRLTLVLSVGLAIISSFTFVLGLLIWPIGLLSLITQRSKIYIIPWISSAIFYICFIF